MIKVLIADDETLVRAGIKAVLPWEEHGFEVIGEAWNGEDAYRKIVTLKPDILITDIKMPQMDGISLLKKLKEENLPIKTIILSCFDDFDLVREGMKYGATDYILKLSIEPGQLLSVLDEIKRDLLAAKAQPDDFIIHNEDLKYLFIKKLITQEFFSDKQVKNVIFNLGLSVNLQNYRLIQLLPQEKEIKQEHRKKESDMLIYNILDQICKRHPGNEIIPMEQEGYLVIHSSGNWRSLRTQISASMKEYANAKIYIGSSGILNNYREFRSGIQQSKESLECSLFYDRSEETENKDLCRIPIPTFPYQQEQELFSALMAANSTHAWKICENMMNHLREKLYPPAECFTYIMEILDIYRRAARDCSISIRSMEFGDDNIYEHIKQQKTLLECQQVLRTFTEKLTEDIRKLCVTGQRDEILSIKEYINLHYQENIDLNTVSQLVNMTPSHLSSLFKKETGENFSVYLTEVRMKEAQRLLNNSNALIYEVAELTGYANSSYFGKAFKKFYGITPEEYKKRRKGNLRDAP